MVPTYNVAVPEETVAQETTPDPFVCNTWLAVPSVLGNKNAPAIETLPVPFGVRVKFALVTVVEITLVLPVIVTPPTLMISILLLASTTKADEAVRVPLV